MKVKFPCKVYITINIANKKKINFGSRFMGDDIAVRAQLLGRTVQTYILRDLKEV